MMHCTLLSVTGRPMNYMSVIIGESHLDRYGGKWMMHHTL